MVPGAWLLPQELSGNPFNNPTSAIPYATPASSGYVTMISPVNTKATSIPPLNRHTGYSNTGSMDQSNTIELVLMRVFVCVDAGC